MKNVMAKAWEIARGAVNKFGGKVSEYFSQALRMAWAYCKAAGDDKQLLDRLNNKLVKMWADKENVLKPKYGTRSVFIKICINNNLNFYTLDVVAKTKLGKQLAAAGF